MKKTLLLEKVAVPGVEEVRPPLEMPDGRPHPDWVRGRCPECGEALVSNLYFRGQNGYLLVWECWSSRGETPLCTYRRVL